MNCLLYARVSTDKQAEKELSLPAQLEAMRGFARQHGWTILQEFVEPGASARTADRPELQKLLSRVRDRELRTDIVLVHKIDRLARNVYDHATIKALLKQHEVQLASVVENVDDTVPGQLVENIMASIAQFFSANLSEETKKGMRQKVLQGGWPHRPPRGYVTLRSDHESDSRVAIHPREGPLVRKAFELYATGLYSVVSVSRRLAREGLISRSGGSIPKSQMHRLLTNPFYIGRVRWKDVNVAGQHPPLVKESLFKQVQSVIKTRYRSPGVRKTTGLPLRGFASCSGCRGKMTGEWHGRWGYYRCSRRSYRKESCDSRMCSSRRAHSDLERVCLQVQLTRQIAADIGRAAETVLAERLKDAATDETRIETERQQLLASELRLTDAFTTGDLSPEAFRTKTLTIRTRRGELDAAAAHQRRDPADVVKQVRQVLATATSLWDLYDKLDDPKRSELLRTVFSSIVLGADGIAGFSLKPPFSAFVSTARNGRSAAAMGEDLAAAVLAAP
jgi:site-specific DNA recombinase